MPGERVSMRKIHEVLRLRFAQGLSQRAIGVSLGLSTGAVNSYLGRARMVGLNWPLAEEFSDAELETLLYPLPPELAAERRPVPDWAKLAKVPPAKQVECQMRGWCIASCGGGT